MRDVATSVAAFSPPGRAAGVVLAGVCGAVALLTAFRGRTRLPAGVVVAVLAACGAGFAAAGALVDGVEMRSGGRQVVAAAAALAVLTPLHVRAVFGPLGRRRT